MSALNGLVADWVKRNGFEFFRRRGLPLEIAHLREKKQPRHRRRLNDREVEGKNTTASSTAATARSRARPSAFPIWVTRQTRTITQLLGWLDDCPENKIAATRRARGSLTRFPTGDSFPCSQHEPEITKTPSFSPKTDFPMKADLVKP